MSIISDATRISTNHNFDDHSGVESSSDIRAGLAQAVNGADVPEYVGSYKTMELALAELGKLMAAQSPQEVLLIGVGSSGMSGKEGCGRLKAQLPLSPPKSARRIIHLFRTVPPSAQVGYAAPISVKVGLLHPPPAQVGYALTPHETRVLSLLVEGHNYKTAAIELGVSVNTVSFHVRRVYDKLQVHSKSEAVAKALKNRLV